jgi:hypothetical protein
VAFVVHLGRALGVEVDRLETDEGEEIDVET